MPIVATNEKKFTPAPQGVHQAVCVDVVDLGKSISEYKGKKTEVHKIQIVFQTEERNPETEKRFQVSQFLNLTLNEKGKLRPFLEHWRNKKFTEDEIKSGFDVEKLIGANARIQVLHNERGYADISSIQPIGKNDEKLEPEDYVRRADRSDNGSEDHVKSKDPDEWDEDNPIF